MGNDIGCELDQENNTQLNSAIHKNYIFIKEIKDQRFGDIQIYKDKKNPENQIFIKTHWSNSEEDYTSLLSQFSKRMKYQHSNILRIIGFNQNSETQICGDYSKITCYFEYLNLNLKKEIIKRQQQSNYFSEPEIWYLLDSIISACSFFEQNKIYHGDIKPINVLLTQQGYVKIADHGIVNSVRNGYIKALQNNEYSYLSPSLLNSLKNEELTPAHNVYKSDIFSLGMTILECCLLQNIMKCYNFESFYINQGLIQQFLTQARQKYSPFLINLIREMLNFDERQRPTFYEIQCILAPYRAKIQNIVPFTADYTTIKQNYGNPEAPYVIKSTIICNQTPILIPIQPQQGLNLLNQSFSQIRSSQTSQYNSKSPNRSRVSLTGQQSQQKQNPPKNSQYNTPTQQYAEIPKQLAFQKPQLGPFQYYNGQINNKGQYQGLQTPTIASINNSQYQTMNNSPISCFQTNQKPLVVNQQQNQLRESFLQQKESDSESEIQFNAEDEEESKICKQLTSKYVENQKEEQKK